MSKKFKFDLESSVEWTFPFMQEPERAEPFIKRLLWVHHVSKSEGMSLVTWHKRMFGRQSTCSSRHPESV